MAHCAMYAGSFLFRLVLLSKLASDIHYVHLALRVIVREIVVEESSNDSVVGNLLVFVVSTVRRFQPSRLRWAGVGGFRSVTE